ncbi:MAG: hypothetical protein M3Q29_06175, partial [Chloroflexota bacterium]|nr:hypothetical protein [Chloroflexota bacterium]
LADAERSGTDAPVSIRGISITASSTRHCLSCSDMLRLFASGIFGMVTWMIARRRELDEEGLTQKGDEIWGVLGQTEYGHTNPWE